MAKRRENRKGKQPLVSDGTATDGKQCQPEMNRRPSTHQELQSQIAAVKAVSDIQIQHLLTSLRLFRSYFSEEQEQKPVLQYFKDELPNVSLVRNGDKGFELRWKDDDGNVSMFNGTQGDISASLFQHMSMAYPSYSAARQSFGGYQFSAGTTKTDIAGVDDLQIGNYMTQESLNTLMLGLPEGLQTPGANSQRLSIGTTPKTVRLPKPGEMLLSVHGSPLGVYKEDNMEAIHESEEA